MKIICKWVYKEKQYIKAKQKDCSDMNSEECLNMITTLLAQTETIRIIFEREENKND